MASASLTAGDVDDNLNFADYLSYTDASYATNSLLPHPDLTDRITLRLTAPDGGAVSWARVVYGDADNATVRPATVFTGSDGVVRLFPTYDLGTSPTNVSIEVYSGDRSTPSMSTVAYLQGTARDVSLQLRSGTGTPEALDVMVVLDTTGSMDDEYQYLAAELGDIMTTVKEAHPSVDIRYSLVVYRDTEDAYTVRPFAFTDSLDSILTDLANQSAEGGGDVPEAVDEALAAALQQEWRAGNTAKIMWLVLDAPPHDAKTGATMDALREARAEGIRIFPVVGSGASPSVEQIFRLGAVLTGGRYAFLTDDSGVGGSHAEPTVACYQVTEFKDLMGRVVDGELSGHRVEADPSQVVRTVGNYQDGVCGADESTETPPTPAEPTVEPMVPAGIRLADSSASAGRASSGGSGSTEASHTTEVTAVLPPSSPGPVPTLAATPPTVEPHSAPGSTSPDVLRSIEPTAMYGPEAAAPAGFEEAAAGRGAVAGGAAEAWLALLVCIGAGAAVLMEGGVRRRR